MDKHSERRNSSLRADIKRELRIWLNSLPAAATNTKCLYAWGQAYSPAELLEAVENATEVGKEFLSALSLVHRKMKKKNPKSSVTDLIRKSIIPSASHEALGATAGGSRASNQ